MEQAKLDSKVGFQFLMTELQSGLTFANLAADGDPRMPHEIEFDKKNAQKAYETILRMRDRINLNDQQTAHLEAGLESLKEAIENLEKNPPRIAGRRIPGRRL